MQRIGLAPLVRVSRLMGNLPFPNDPTAQILGLLPPLTLALSTPSLRISIQPTPTDYAILMQSNVHIQSLSLSYRLRNHPTFHRNILHVILPVSIRNIFLNPIPTTLSITLNQTKKLFMSPTLLPPQIIRVIIHRLQSRRRQTKNRNLLLLPYSINSILNHFNRSIQT